MELYELDDLINGLGIEPTQQQLDELFAEFDRDFIQNPFKVNGFQVKVILASSAVPGFEAYPETFVHLITRKGTGKQRLFDRHRANKIHWIKCILENRKEDDITFFKYPEDDGSLRDYYWLKDENFLVIMEKVAPDYLVITSFHIDNKRNRAYFEEKEKWYRDNKV
jgi:hypothetical protein